MAKLLIYRGESLLDERELTGQTLKIGRAAQNDIVLEDPGKGVSREHAEIRFEGGRYTLVDRQSQNGIWVSGARVPSVVLDRDVVASVGPYRLTVKADAAPVAPPEIDDTSALDVPVAVPIEEAAAEPVPPSIALPSPLPADVPADPALPSESSAAPLDLDNLAPPPKPSSGPPAPPVVVSTGASQRVPKAAPPPKPKPSPNPRVLGMVAAALLLVGLSGLVAYKVMHPKPSGPTVDVNVAQSLVNSGRCAEAMEKQINPALAQRPNDEAWRKLRDQCAAPPETSTITTTTSVPQGPTVEERLSEAQQQIDKKDCQTAVAGISAVLAEDPNNDRAKELLGKATACAKPPQTTTSIPAVDPSKGELPKLKGESDKDHKDREAKARQTLEEAIVLIQTRKYTQAKRLLDDFANDVPSNFLGLAQRRDELAKAMQADARNALINAQAIDHAVTDKAEEYDTAVNFYRHAHEMDPTIQVDAAIARLNEKRVAVGTDKCKKGMAQYVIGNTAAALPLLQDAVKLVPPSQPDTCLAQARQALQTLQRVPK